MVLNIEHQKTILVTGASSGIGLATCELLVQKGFQVFGGVKPGSDDLPLREAGAIPLALDVTSMSSLEAALDTIEGRVGDEALWGLVNSAGVVAAGPVELHDIDEARKVFEVNVVGVLATVQTFLPLIRSTGGRIVNLSSLSGLLAVPFLGPYCASKAAIESLSDSMRRELRPLGVDVIAIQPGATRTRMWNKAEEIDLEPFKGSPYGPATAKVTNRAVGRGHRGQSPRKVAEAIHLALTSKSPPTRIRVQRKRLSRLFYSLLPLLPDNIVDRKITEAVWDDLK